MLFLLFSSCEKQKIIPVITTAPVSDIRNTSAFTGGTLVSDGGSEILSKGVCWSEGGIPDINSSIAVDSSGYPSFSMTISGLNPRNNYSLRAFAKNSVGVGYGPVVKFSTLAENVVVLDGDSRTDGWNCEYRYPYMDLLSLNEPCAVFKTSFGGLTSADLLSRASELVDTKYSNQARMNILVVWVGVNDIAVGDKSALETFNNLKAYCLERRFKGWKVIVCTEISMKGSGSFGECDLVRQEYNQLILSNYQDFADVVAKLHEIPEIGSYGAHLNGAFFCDGIHLTNSGTALIGQKINKEINLLIDL